VLVQTLHELRVDTGVARVFPERLREIERCEFLIREQAFGTFFELRDVPVGDSLLLCQSRQGTQSISTAIETRDAKSRKLFHLC